VLSNDLTELLGGNALYVVKRLVVLDIYRTGRGNRGRGFIGKTAGLIEGTGGRHYGSGPKDRGKEVVAFGGFNFGFRFRFLYAARYFISGTT